MATPEKEFRAWVMLTRNQISQKAFEQTRTRLDNIQVNNDHEAKLSQQSELVFLWCDLYGQYDILVGVVATNLRSIISCISKIEDANKGLIRTSETFVVVPEGRKDSPTDALGDPFNWKRVDGERKVVVGIDVDSDENPIKVQRALRSKFGRTAESNMAVDMVFGRYDIILVAGINPHDNSTDSIKELRNTLQDTPGIVKTATMFSQDFLET